MRKSLKPRKVLLGHRTGGGGGGGLLLEEVSTQIGIFGTLVLFKVPAMREYKDPT